MSERLRYIKRPEREQSQKGTIYFESGDHPLTPYTDVDMGLVTGGDLNYHVWNPEVAARINYSPGLLAIDGLHAPYFRYEQPDTFTLNDKVAVWFVLPARPKLLNPTGRVRVVQGDLILPNLIDKVFSEDDPDLYVKLRQLNQVRQGMIDLQNKYLRETYDGSKNEIVVRSGVFTGILYASLLKAFEEAETSKEKSNKESSNKISRRTFLKYASFGLISMIGGITGATGSLLVPIAESALASDQNTENFWQDVGQVTRPRIWPSKWAIGRTAIVVAKTEDALRSENAAIVMGNYHSFEAKRLIQDPQARQDAIVDFIRQLLRDADDIVKNFHLISREKAREAILNNVAKTSIVEVIDPSMLDVPVLPFPKILDYCIQRVSIFQSPQVEQALQKV